MKKPKPKHEPKMKREYGIGDFLSEFIYAPGGGIRSAVAKAKREDDARQMFLKFDGRGLKIN